MAKCTQCGKTSLFLQTNVEGMCPDCQKRTLFELRQTYNDFKRLEKSLSPEQRGFLTLSEEIEELNKRKVTLDNSIHINHQTLNKLATHLENIKREIVETEEAILLQSFGLYEPKYDFVNSEQYKNRLDEIRRKQKTC